MATLAHRLLSEANSPKPAGLRKTSRPLWGAGRYQDGARLLPSPLGKQAVGLAALARPPDTTTLHDSGELLTVCSWPERYWELREEQRGTGRVWGHRQHLPPPINALHCQAGAGHCSRWEKRLFFLSQPLMGRAGGGCWATRAGWKPTLTTLPLLSWSSAGLRGGKPSGSPRGYPWVPWPLDGFLTCWDAGHPQMDWKAHP